MEVIHILSTEYRDNVKAVKCDFPIPQDIWIAGHVWALSGKKVICEENTESNTKSCFDIQRVENQRCQRGRPRKAQLALVRQYTALFVI